MRIVLTEKQRLQLIEDLTSGDSEIEIVPAARIDYCRMFYEISLSDFLNDTDLRYHAPSHARRVCNALARNTKGGNFNDLPLDEFMRLLRTPRFRDDLRNVGPTAPDVLEELLKLDGVKRIVKRYTDGNEN